MTTEQMDQVDHDKQIRGESFLHGSIFGCLVGIILGVLLVGLIFDLTQHLGVTWK